MITPFVSVNYPVATIKSWKNNKLINKLDKLVDKSISFHLTYGLTGFNGFIVNL